MSSFHSTGDAPTQRVPAWKRLGLKLKPASEGQQSHDATAHHSTSSVTSSVPNNRPQFGGSTTPNAKRKASGPASASDNSAKRIRQDNTKSVSFAADTTPGPRPKTKTKQQKPTTPAKIPVHAPPVKPIRTAPVNLEPALAYLRTWHTARDSWKFNKNHQTKLLEQVFADANEATIPAVDIGIFYEYIRGLQGHVRTRLRELANGIKAQDMEQGFAASANNKTEMEMAERKQKEYEQVIKAFLGQPRTPEKRRFEEVDYVLRTTDMEMQRRVVKRMRAEMVLDELSETDESETTATTTSAESTSTEKGGATDNVDGQSTAEEGKRLKLNDGSQQRVKRKRKTRTAVVDDDTSSESESEDESDSDTSSSGSSSGDSSSEDSDDDDEAPAAGRNEETSSSSSSSSSGSESDSEDDDED